MTEGVAARHRGGDGSGHLPGSYHRARVRKGVEVVSWPSSAAGRALAGEPRHPLSRARFGGRKEKALEPGPRVSGEKGGKQKQAGRARAVAGPRLGSPVARA